MIAIVLCNSREKAIIRHVRLKFSFIVPDYIESLITGQDLTIVLSYSVLISLHTFS